MVEALLGALPKGESRSRCPKQPNEVSVAPKQPALLSGTRQLHGTAAAVGLFESVTSRTAGGPAIDASINHFRATAGNLTDVIHPKRRACRAGDRHRRAAFLGVDRRCDCG